MDIESRVRRGFEKQGFMARIGAGLVEIGPGICHISVPFSEKVVQQHGLFHGGVTASLADTTAGFAAYTLMNDDEQPLSVEFKINYLAPAGGDLLLSKARVIRNGRRIKHVQADVFARQGSEEQLVAISLVTIAASKSVTERDDS